MCEAAHAVPAATFRGVKCLVGRLDKLFVVNIRFGNQCGATNRNGHPLEGCRRARGSRDRGMFGHIPDCGRYRSIQAGADE